MTPRRRSKKNKGLPDNLYCTPRKGRDYFYYTHPKTKKNHGFGYTKKDAVDAAKQLNTLLEETPGLVARVIARGETFGEYISKYRKNILPNRRINTIHLSSRTIEEYGRILKHADGSLGHIPLSDITQANVAKYLNSLVSADVHNRHRAILSLVFKQAISDGLLRENWPMNILPKDKEPVIRHRLTLDGFKAIQAHASSEMQIAMDLALQTLQRREDIRQVRFENLKDGTLFVIQSKTKRHGEAAYLAINVAKSSIPKIFSKARLSGIASPYVVHRNPIRRMKSKTRDHWSQLSPAQVSDGFAGAREASGYYSALADIERPTFHEIRALGADLYRKAGWTEKDIQRLLGHAKEKQTAEYLSRHDINWTQCSAGLDV